MTTATATTQRTDALAAVVNAIHDYLPDAVVESLDTGHDRIHVEVRPAAGSDNFTVTDAARLLERLCTTCDGSRATADNTDRVVTGVCTRHHVAVWVTVHVTA